MDTPLPLEVEVAKCLISLRQETQKAIEEATGIRTTNLSSWLRGKPQSISLPRVSLLLNHLGVFHMKLRKDRLHDWVVPVDEPEVLPRLLNLLGENDLSKATIYSAAMREADAMESHVLVIDSFASSPVMRIQECTAIYNGHFVNDLPVGQKLTILNDLWAVPGDTVAKYRRNLEKSLEIIEHSSTSEFQNHDHLAFEKSLKAATIKSMDAFLALSRMLSIKDKNAVAEALLQQIHAGTSINELIETIKQHPNKANSR